MNTLKLLSTLCLSFVAFTLQAQTKEISGGVVFSTGSDIVYYDFVKKEKKSLIADEEKVAINGPFAVSENGQRLIFGLSDKIYSKKLPMGKAVALRFPNFFSEKTGKFSPKRQGEELKVQGQLRSLSISPNGESFFCEIEKMGMSSVKLPSGLECIKKPDTYNAIWLVDFQGEDRIQFGMSKFGNLAIFPGVPCTEKPGTVVLRTSPPEYGNGITLTVPDAIQRFSIKRNAFFGVWSKAKSQKDQLFAVIYQTANGWGPIEIRDSTAHAFFKGKDDYAGKTAGICEIPVLLENCHGLAWKPDGSLTYLSGGKLFSLNGGQIARGMQNSGLARNPNRYCYVPVPVNNILPINPVLLAEGVLGVKLQWTDENSFLVRGFDKGIYYWEAGVAKKITPNSPEEFSYVNLSSDFDISSSVPDLTGAPRWIRGKSKSPNSITGAESGYHTYFNVGNIKTAWQSISSLTERTNEFALELIVPNQEALEFCILDEGIALENVNDPSVYKFTKSERYRIEPKKRAEAMRKKTFWHPEDRIRRVVCPLNRVVLLKLDYSCAGIWGEKIVVNNSEIVSPTGSRLMAGESGTMDYQWKFWPDVRPTKVAGRATQSK